MTCDACEHHVTRAIAQAGGGDVTASWRQGNATFTATDPDPTVLSNAVTDAGYRAGALRAGSGGGEWDLAIIGSGGAAFAAAIRATNLGARVAGTGAPT